MTKGEVRARLAVLDAQIHLRHCEQALAAQLEHDRKTLAASIEDHRRRHPSVDADLDRWMRSADEVDENVRAAA